MICPRCRSDRVSIQVITDSARTRKRGCLWGIGRLFLILCTCGLWLLIGRSKSKTKMQTHKEAICQNCGYSFHV